MLDYCSYPGKKTDSFNACHPIPEKLPVFLPLTWDHCIHFPHSPTKKPVGPCWCFKSLLLPLVPRGKLRGSRFRGAVNANSLGSGSFRSGHCRLLQMIDRLCWDWTGVAWVVISDSPKRLGFELFFFFLWFWYTPWFGFHWFFFVILINRLLRRRVCVCVLVSLECHMCALWRSVFWFREIYFAGEDSLFS